MDQVIEGRALAHSGQYGGVLDGRRAAVKCDAVQAIAALAVFMEELAHTHRTAAGRGAQFDQQIVGDRLIQPHDGCVAGNAAHRQISGCDANAQTQRVDAPGTQVISLDGVVAIARGIQVDVAARPAVQLVVTTAAHQQVVAGISQQLIRAGTAEQRAHAQLLCAPDRAVGKAQLLHAGGAQALVQRKKALDTQAFAGIDLQHQVITADALAAQADAGRRDAGAELDDIQPAQAVVERIDRVNAAAQAELENIVAGATAQSVVAWPADQAVVAGLAKQHVVAGQAVDQVVARRAVDRVVTRRRTHGGGSDGRRVERAIGHLQKVDARHDAKLALHAQAVAAGDDGDEQVAALARQPQLGALQAAGINAVGLQRRQQPVLATAKRQAEGVAACAAIEVVIAGATVQRVVAGIAVQLVAASAALQQVGTRAALQQVGARATGQGVVARIAKQTVIAAKCVEDICGRCAGVVVVTFGGQTGARQQLGPIPLGAGCGVEAHRRHAPGRGATLAEVAVHLQAVSAHAQPQVVGRAADGHVGHGNVSRETDAIAGAGRVGVLDAVVAEATGKDKGVLRRAAVEHIVASAAADDVGRGVAGDAVHARCADQRTRLDRGEIPRGRSRVTEDDARRRVAAQALVDEVAADLKAVARTGQQQVTAAASQRQR